MAIIWSEFRIFIIISGCEYCFWNGISHTKQQFVVTHTIRHNWHPPPPPNYYTPSVKMSCPQKIASPFYVLVQNITCWNAGTLKVCTNYSPVSCKTLYRWVLINYFFMGEIWIKTDEKMTWLQAWPGYGMRNHARTHAPTHKRKTLSPL